MPRFDSSTFDVASVDGALLSTRAVRRRLDLERDVDNEIIYDCIDVAEQAPTGGNQGSRRWIVVRDPALKARLAELYMASAGQWMVEARDKIAGTGHPNERVMASAAHLAEHLTDVPAIVIPTIIGRHDGSGRPGLFDSVIQSAWSFCVALRARGLGTAWTTAILNAEDEIAELLGIPATMTQIAMIPVAWTTGTEFGAAPRYPAREIAYIDGFARTWERGPSTPHRLADGPGTVAEVDIKAPIATVWELVTDINLGKEFSSEFLGAEWTGGHTGPALGATFTGRNQHDAIGQWEVPCFVDRYDDGGTTGSRQFGWCTSDVDNPGARWRFDLEPIAGSVRLRFRVIVGPGPSGLTMAAESMPDKEPRIIERRMQEHFANMTAVAEGIKAAAEGGGS
ncbi:MAG: nitroreductase family protein [Actinomycetota bacterium]